MTTENQKPQTTVSEEQLRSASAALLQEKESSMDAATLSALHKSRSAALDQTKSNALWWPAIGTVATAALVAAVFLPVSPATQESPLQVAATLSAEDLELLNSAEELEFLEELEFYAWLEETETEMDDA